MSDGSEKTPQSELQARIDALSREAEALEGDVRAAVKRLRAGLAKIGEEVAALGAAADGDDQGGHESGADVDGARLAALDLVLRDTPRAEAQALLAEQFPGVDAGLLLDEVSQASAG